MLGMVVCVFNMNLISFIKEILTFNPEKERDRQEIIENEMVKEKIKNGYYTKRNSKLIWCSKCHQVMEEVLKGQNIIVDTNNHQYKIFRCNKCTEKIII
jgi:CRISPR/Cas system CSM-associated protein Csm2 small subunit